MIYFHIYPTTLYGNLSRLLMLWMNERRSVQAHQSSQSQYTPTFIMIVHIPRQGVQVISILGTHCIFIHLWYESKKNEELNQWLRNPSLPSPSACTACQTRRRIVWARNNLELNWSIIWLMRNHWMYRPPELLSVAYTVHTLKIKKVRFVNHLCILIGELLYTI